MYKGKLYKQYNVWYIEYEQTIKNKVSKKQIEIHPEDVSDIDDGGHYMNNFDFKDIYFDIVLITNENSKSKTVAKVVKKDLPHLKIDNEDLDD
jgi:hypothetical protein